MAGEDVLDGGGNVLVGPGFIHKAGGAGGKSRTDIGATDLAADEEDVRGGVLVLDQTGGFEAIHDRHTDVQQQQIGLVKSHGGDRVAAIRGLSEDTAVGKVVEELPQLLEGGRVVVGQHDSRMA